MSHAIELEFAHRPSALAYMLRGAWPSTRRGPLVPALSACWRGHRVNPRELSAFLAMTGLEPTSTLPLLYPHTFGFRLAMAVLTHPAFPVPIWSVLQTRNHLLRHHPIDLGASLDFEVRVRAARVLEKGAEIDLHTAVEVDGALAWESLVTFYVRGRFGEPGPPSPLAQAPAEVGEPVARWRMSDDGHLALGRFTGDYNGIHLWSWYARRFGFRRALYHPPRVLALCLAHLPAPDPERPERLDAWLKGPVPHAAEVRLRAKTRGDESTFALFADDERPSILGVWRGVEPDGRLGEEQPT